MSPIEDRLPPLLRLPPEVLHQLAIQVLYVSSTPEIIKDVPLGYPTDPTSSLQDTPCADCSASSSSAAGPSITSSKPPICRYCPSPPVTLTIPHPQHLLPLLLTCRTLNARLKLDGNESLYQHLYFETFDTDPVLRRFHRGPHTLPAALAYHADSERRKRKCKSRESHHAMSIMDLISPTEGSERWSCSTFPLRNCPMRGEPFRSFDLIGDPAPLAVEYRERFAMFRRMRLCVMFKSLDVNGSRGQVEGDLWKIWWMITENDGRNSLILQAHSYINGFLLLFFNQIYLKDGLSPGYPEDTVEKALVTWIAVRTGDGKAEESNEQVDEKVFILKPYVFACHKYPVHLAPWIFRVLPLSAAARDSTELELMSRPNPFMADLSPEKMSVPVFRFGREYEVVPFPFNSDGCAVTYINTVVRHPRMSAKRTEMDFGINGLPSFDFSTDTLLPLVQAAYPSSGPSATPSKSTVVKSCDFDRDFIRSMRCCNPVNSPGLPPLFYRHTLQGQWSGRSLCMDLPAYRSMLSGNMRSLYDGACGELQQDFFLEESIICIREDLIGGSGPLLTAGFNLSQTPEQQYAEAKLTTEERGWEPCQDETAANKIGWTKEILLSGRGRCPWGWCTIRGRVRSWDGMVILLTQYDGAKAPSRWHWRGYMQAGGMMVGRWRDTFTKENMRGYEGSFVMYKAGSALHNKRELEAVRQSLKTKSDQPAEPTVSSSSTAPSSINLASPMPSGQPAPTLSKIWHPFDGFKRMAEERDSFQLRADVAARLAHGTEMPLSRLAKELDPVLGPATPEYHSRPVREAFTPYYPTEVRDGRKREAEEEIAQDFGRKKNRPW